METLVGHRVAYDLPHFPTFSAPPQSSTSPYQQQPSPAGSQARHLSHRNSISTSRVSTYWDYTLEFKHAQLDIFDIWGPSWSWGLSQDGTSRVSKFTPASNTNTSMSHPQQAHKPHRHNMPSNVPASISVNGTREGRAPRSPSHVRRASIGSIGEDVTDIPQSFLDRGQKFPPSPDSDLSNPRDNVHNFYLNPEFYCPSGAFQGWKQAKLGVRKQSKSFSDLRRLASRTSEWVWDSEDKGDSKEYAPVSPLRKVGIEDLPFEILDMILSNLTQDLCPDSYGPRNKDLIACLMTCRLLHAATLSVLYKNVTIPFSITFSKMLNHITKYPGLGTLVRRLDFSHYTSVGFGRTRRGSSEIQNVTPKTLLRCLELSTNLKEFQVHEHIDDELDEDVLKMVFSMHSIHALDFCACSSRRFASGFTASITANNMLPNPLSNLKRLSLHACTTLQAPVFEVLLPRLPNLTHLDVGMTLITDKALLSIPPSARITHLGLGKCTRITGPKIVEFLTTHEAVKNSLVFLNVMADRSRYLLLSESDVEALLPRLSPSIRSLNIGGAQISNKHIPLLRPLTKHLEELGLSNADLTVSDINSFFLPNPPADGDESDVSDEELNWEPCTLRCLDLTAVPSLQPGTLFSSCSVLATPHSYPLEVIELSDPVVQQLKNRASTSQRLGWTVKELGRRGWYVRIPTSDHTDDGRRSWKMGARWWGMRKVPVAVQEVGGMYGHYMFKS